MIVALSSFQVRPGPCQGPYSSTTFTHPAGSGFSSQVPIIPGQHETSVCSETMSSNELLYNSLNLCERPHPMPSLFSNGPSLSGCANGFFMVMSLHHSMFCPLDYTLLADLLPHSLIPFLFPHQTHLSPLSQTQETLRFTDRSAILKSSQSSERGTKE